MYDNGQKVLVYLDKEWVPATIQFQLKGWDYDFQRQYSVVLDTPYWNRDEQLVSMVFPGILLRAIRPNSNPVIKCIPDRLD